MGNARKRKNYLVKIRVNREILSEDANIKDGVTNFFHNLVSKTMEWRPNINGMSFEILSREDSESLETLFFEEKTIKSS